MLELACGVRSFLSDKFDITKHKNYKLLEDFDEKNLFDIERCIKRKGKVKLNRQTIMWLYKKHYIRYDYINRSEFSEEDRIIERIYFEFRKRILFDRKRL